MKNNEIYNLWTEFISDSRYSKYFISNEEDWKNKLDELKQFIDLNNDRPTGKNNKELNKWLSHQITNSKNRQHSMKDDEIYNLWTEFINDTRYKKYFDLDNIRDWKNKLEKLKQFIDDNLARPTPKSNKELDNWMTKQIQQSNKRLYIMKDEYIYNLWTEFISDSRYSKYFDLDNVKDWKIKLEEVKQFIDTNNARPTVKYNQTLCSWISNQVKNSKKRLDIMKNDEIYNLWNDFVNDTRYKKYFDLDNVREWKNNLEEIKQFIDENGKRPTEKNNQTLCSWISTQLNISKKRLKIMKNDEIYNIWNEFISDPRYKKYFDLDNVREWKNRLDELKLFIDNNNARPTPKSNKELYSWLSHQITNSKNRQYNMKNDEIYNSWNEFISDSRYKKYFE